MKPGARAVIARSAATTRSMTGEERGGAMDRFASLAMTGRVRRYAACARFADAMRVAIVMALRIACGLAIPLPAMS